MSCATSTCSASIAGLGIGDRLFSNDDRVEFSELAGDSVDLRLDLCEQLGLLNGGCESETECVAVGDLTLQACG